MWTWDEWEGRGNLGIWVFVNLKFEVITLGKLEEKKRGNNWGGGGGGLSY